MTKQEPPETVVRDAVAQGLIGASQAALDATEASAAAAKHIAEQVAELAERTLALDRWELELTEKQHRVDNEWAKFNGARGGYRVARESKIRKFLFERSSQEPPPPEPDHADPTDITGADNRFYNDLLKAEKNSAADARARARQWLAGITAFIGLITTASVLTAPDVSDLKPDQLYFAAGTAVAGFAVLAASLVFAYRAAYGDPGDELLIKRGVRADMEQHITEARRAVAQESARNLTTGVVLAIIGIAVVLVGTVATWLPLDETEPATTATLCVKVGDKQVVKISGAGLSTTALDGAAVESC